MGEDAVISLNIIHTLEQKGITCEIALDHNAQGLLFKNHGYDWYKISIPQAGGHSATKLAIIKAGIRTIKSAFEVRNLIKN